MKRKIIVCITYLLLICCTSIFIMIEARMLSIYNLWNEITGWETTFKSLYDSDDLSSLYTYCTSLDTIELADKLSDRSNKLQSGVIGNYTSVGKCAWLVGIQADKMERVINDALSYGKEDAWLVGFYYYTEDIIVAPPIAQIMIKYLVCFIIISSILIFFVIRNRRDLPVRESRRRNHVSRP